MGLERGAGANLPLKATELKNHLKGILVGIFDLKRGDKLNLGIQENLVFVPSSNDMGYPSMLCPEGIPFLTIVTLALLKLCPYYLSSVSQRLPFLRVYRRGFQSP